MLPNAPSTSTSPASTVLPVEQLRPGRYQSRRSFDETTLLSLADTIRRDGLAQPILVRPVSAPAPVRYEIIAGERRWRAVQRIGWSEIPAVVRDGLDDRAVATLTLVENLQRDDLGPMETARGIASLHHDLGLPQDEIGARIGVSQSTVAHYLRLLTLPPPVRILLEDGALSLGHGKALLAAPASQREALALRAVRSGCSVRQLERWAKAAVGTTRTCCTGAATHPPWLREQETRIAEAVGARVELTFNERTTTGTVVIHYSSLDEYEGLVDRLVGR